MKPVIVEWVDASVDPGFDGFPADVRPGSVFNRTIGFLLREDRTEVLVVRDVSPAENTIRWPYSIPRKMVRRIIPLEAADAPKE